MTPTGTAISTEIEMASTAISIVVGSVCSRRAVIELSSRRLLPKSRRAAPPSHAKYCSYAGRSRPRSFSIRARASPVIWLSPAIWSTTPPGISRTMKKTSSDTPTSVGTASNRRRRMYVRIPLHGIGTAVVPAAPMDVPFQRARGRGCRSTACYASQSFSETSVPWA